MFTEYLALTVAAMACLAVASPTPDQTLAGFPPNGISYFDVLEYWKGQGAQPSKIDGEGNETTHHWTFNREQYDTAIAHLSPAGGVVARSSAETITPVGSVVARSPAEASTEAIPEFLYKAVCSQTGVKAGNAVISSLVLGVVCSYTIDYLNHLWVVNVIEKHTELQRPNNQYNKVYLRVAWVWEKTVTVNAGSACTGGLGYLINTKCEEWHTGNMQATDINGNEVARAQISMTPE